MHKEKIYIGDEILFNVLFGGKMYFALWNKMFKSSLADGLRFDEKYQFGEDLIFIYQYLKKCKSIFYTSRPLYHYINNPNSEMHKKFRQSQIDLMEFMFGQAIKEKSLANKNAILGWYAFVNAVYYYQTRKVENFDKMKRRDFAINALKYKDYLLKVGRVCFLFKLIFGFIKTFFMPRKMQETSKV